MIYGDADKLARVFQSVLRNAAVYSFEDTSVMILGREMEGAVEVVQTGAFYVPGRRRLSYEKDEMKKYPCNFSISCYNQSI